MLRITEQPMAASKELQSLTAEPNMKYRHTSAYPPAPNAE